MKNIEKGKILLIIMTIILLMISIFTDYISPFSKSGSSLFTAIIRTALEAMLLYYTFNGKKWAKIIMIILLSISVLGALMVVVFMSTVITNIIFGILLVVYSGSLYIIAFSPSVKAYLKSVNQ